MKLPNRRFHHALTILVERDVVLQLARPHVCVYAERRVRKPPGLRLLGSLDPLADSR
jgi:hypothetical protein